jgi:hypothetical protein
MTAQAATCRTCGAAVIFVTTKNGKLMPVNADDPETSHFATCPQSTQWRKR